MVGQCGVIKSMFDPDFDPYEELLRNKHNIEQLILGLNNCSQLLNELSRQHNQLLLVNKDLQHRVQLLEMRNNSLI